MTQSLADFITTQADRGLLVRELDMVKIALFRGTEKPNLSTLSLSGTTQSFWEHTVNAAGFSPTTLEGLRAELLSFSLIRMTVAFEPTAQFLQSCLQLLRQRTGIQTLMLDVLIDPTIGAGVIYTLNGKIIDLSLSKQLSEFSYEKVLASHLTLFSSSTA